MNRFCLSFFFSEGRTPDSWPAATGARFTRMARVDASRGIRSAQVGLLVNASLAVVKVIAGVLGNSYALIADGIESTADLFSSTIVWGGLRIAARDADADYPFGYGKAESLATATVALMLVLAESGTATPNVREIGTPHQAPETALAIRAPRRVVLTPCFLPW